jgi:hypothetical protein
MATAIGFRVTENDYTGVEWDDPGVTTTVGGGNVVANFHVAGHWHAVCRAAVFRLRGGAGCRVVIVYYDTADVISTTGVGEPSITSYDYASKTFVTDDKTRHFINNGTPWTAPGVAAILATYGL